MDVSKAEALPFWGSVRVGVGEGVCMSPAWISNHMILQFVKVSMSTDCPTIPILWRWPQFCLKIPNPDQHAIGIVFWHLLWHFCTIVVIVAFNTRTQNRVYFTLISWWNKKWQEITQERLLTVLAMLLSGFVVLSAITWHLWLGSRSYFLTWSTQTVLSFLWDFHSSTVTFFLMVSKQLPLFLLRASDGSSKPKKNKLDCQFKSVWKNHVHSFFYKNTVFAAQTEYSYFSAN